MEGQEYTSVEDIKKVSKEHFDKMFQDESARGELSLPKYLPKLVTEEDNFMLNSITSDLKLGKLCSLSILRKSQVQMGSRLCFIQNFGE